MKFKYQAKTKEGATQVGFVEAADRDAASAILASHELFVLSVVADRPPTALDNIAGFFGRVRRKDLIVFTRQLATLLEARLPLNNALKILYEQTDQREPQGGDLAGDGRHRRGHIVLPGDGAAGKDIPRLLY